MKLFKKGNAAVIGIVIIVILLIGGLIFFNSQQPKQEDITIEEPSPTMVTTKEDVVDTKKGGIVGVYTGKVLAGSTTPYLEFNQADYEQALATGKIIVLNFYANWCPICRAETPDIHAGFDSLNNENVVGFRVNFKDDETDDAEKASATEYKIPYQHTKVILKEGQEVYKETVQWSKEDLVEEINKVL